MYRRPQLPSISLHSKLQSRCRSIERDLRTLQDDVVALLADMQNVCESRDSIMRAALRFEREADISRFKTEELQRVNAQLKFAEANKNLKIVQLMQDIEIKQAKLDDMVETLNSLYRNDCVDAQLRCQCCYNEFNQDPIKCTHGHMFCHDCANMRCKMELTSLTIPDERFACLSQCTGYIHWNELTKCSGGICYIGEVYGQRMLNRIVEMLHTNDMSENDLLCKLSLMRTDGSFRALECPRCGWGPILHAHCDDLTTHHEETTIASDGAPSRVNNSCPRCRFLCTDVQQMHPWRGNIHDIHDENYLVE